MSRVEDFPHRCPGCKQKFSKRRQWERHRCRLLRGSSSPPDSAESLVEDGRVEQHEEEACVASA
ncbi:MAG: hypothetical protein PHO20_01920 [Candidatus Peribacteraceae bacterium]|nr:hypothetical protein [Candidatus Peribacteraceae bacterium]MDD5739501.1 hypothetical protein [Candidatus Peribacteraceae bacterium]